MIRGWCEPVPDSNVDARLIRAGWLAVAVVSALIRLPALGAAPLSPGEATEALAALDNVGRWTAAQSSLLLGANHMLFWLLGASDTVARLLPALAGSGLPLMAWLFQRHLGRWGALAAGALLALSPSLVFVSRSATGTVLGIAGGLLAVGALEKADATGERRWTWVAGIAMGLGVASGPAFWSAMLVMALAAMLGRPTGLRRWLASRCGALWRVAVITAGLASTGLLLVPGGLGVAADSLVVWINGFGLGRQGLWAWQVLLVYEPVLLLSGVAGAAVVLLGPNSRVRLMGFWTLVGALLSLVRSGQPDAPLLVVIPLALLGGRLVAALLASLLAQPAWPGFGRSLAAMSVAVGVLGVHLFVNLGQYARHASSNPDSASASLLLVGISIILATGVCALAWTYSHRLAWGSLLVAWLVLLGAYGLGKAWELGHTHRSDPRQLWVAEATSPGARLLVDALESVSSRIQGTPHEVQVTVQGDSALLHWALRDFTRVTWVEQLQAVVTSPVVLTPAGEASPTLGDGYLGVDFGLQLEPNPSTDVASRTGETLRWVLLRDAPLPLQRDKVVLWVRQDLASAGVSWPLP